MSDFGGVPAHVLLVSAVLQKWDVSSTGLLETSKLPSSIYMGNRLIRRTDKDVRRLVVVVRENAE